MRKFLRITGVVVGLLVLAVGATAFYASRTWDDGRYDSYPMPDLRASGDSATIAKGRYLVYGAGHCADCHTPPGGAPFSGGLDFKLPFGHIYSPNITPDSATGIGRYTD